MWVITSGSAYCQLSNNGNCVTDGPGNHNNNERCTIATTQALTATTTYFSTESNYDWITIAGTRFSGTSTSSGPSNVAMASGQTMTWRSDGSVTYGGFTI